MSATKNLREIADVVKEAADFLGTVMDQLPRQPLADELGGCAHWLREIAADVATNGVAAVKTRGNDDDPIVTPKPRVPAWMPIQGTPLAVRIDALSEDQAWQNHDQDLHTLARRGGLSPFEAVALAKRLPLSYVRSLQGVSETERVRTLIIALSEHKV